MRARRFLEVAADVQAVSACLGLAVFPQDRSAAAALLEAADERVLSAKREPQRHGIRRRAA